MAEETSTYSVYHSFSKEFISFNILTLKIALFETFLQHTIFMFLTGDRECINKHSAFVYPNMTELFGHYITTLTVSLSCGHISPMVCWRLILNSSTLSM